MKIVTNNQPRQIIRGYELPENVKKDFDYLSDDHLESNAFFKYKGNYYDLGEFVRCDINGWQAFKNDTYFSGLFIKLTNDNESVIVASYYS